MRIKLLWALAVAGAFFILTTVASSNVVITYDPGGIINDFVNRYSTLRVSGQTVIVDGECISACTLVFAIMPRENICVTPKARFGFHSAYMRQRTPMGETYTFSQLGTDMVWKSYPEAIRQLLRAKGWDGGELHGWQDGALVWLEATDVQAVGIRACTDADFDPWYQPSLWQRFLTAIRWPWF